MPRGAAGSQFSSLLTAFTPRQVLLLNHPLQRNISVSEAMAKNRSEQMESSKTENQKVEDDSVLSYSVALWLSRKGFSKVLKRFLSSAKIQDDTWKDKALDLNDIYRKCHEAVSASYECLTIPEKQDEKGDAASLAAGETVHKNKKKKSGSNGDIDITKDTSNEDLKTHENQVHEDGNLKKRKKKTDCDAASVAPGSFPDKTVNGNKNEVSDNEKQDQQRKQSMKKKDKDIEKAGQLSLDADDKKPGDESVNAKKSKEIGIFAEECKKAALQRKRKALDEPENDTGNEVAAEAVKHKKSKKTDNNQTFPKTEENGHLDEQDKPKSDLPIQISPNSISADHANENAKDSLVHGTAKQVGSKSRKNKSKDDYEPKSVKAFQRVKIDEVTFVDDRLQDNSYWAKDGAKNGYGAKAQEVLGQVKGRDFRHEKTKKKRGSYRGGQIDLHSHSIKFNYSDDE